MKVFLCPNQDSCDVVNKAGFAGDEKKREKYMTDYCRASESKRNRCKRLIMKNMYHFCPDFVLPDTQLTPDEIIDKFEEEISGKN
ncbi:MAG: hypothetical protein FJY07_01875 [Bacteroidetes bacterium]|nr:hypothetical protein [Bacteroidota bacterium]